MLLKSIALDVLRSSPAQIACLWESGPRHYAAAAGLLRDSAPLMKATSTPLEAYIVTMAAHYNATER